MQILDSSSKAFQLFTSFATQKSYGLPRLSADRKELVHRPFDRRPEALFPPPRESEPAKRSNTILLCN